MKPRRNHFEKKYHRRPAKAHSRRKQPGQIKADYRKPTIDPGLRPIFQRIGIPEPEPFKPDPFQLEALGLIEDYDVLVSAATGAGKTWIASQAIRSYLARDLRVWYASPLKALSNSIYREFCNEFGPSSCGILTGDRKENAGAPVIVGTTEILRNQLYDAMHEGSSIRTDLVILDEAHYLSDPDRGVVWEEVLIYLPSRVRLLLLSATLSNAEEMCEWLRTIRGTSNRVVCAAKRPVPLEMLFLFPSGHIVPLAGKMGLNSKIKKFLSSQAGRGRRRSGKINFGNIISCLREFDLLPAIFFLKSRTDCDQAILTCPRVDKAPETRTRIKEGIKAFLRSYPHLAGHRQMKPLTESLVGSHHGGQLPYWKVLIENMMNMGYLDAIFSTSTVAAGVNFPARTVALVQSDRYNGREFVDLTATDLHQMIGRAGRRGKDRIGFGLVIPGLHQDPQLIHELKDSPAEPILSQIHINFSMTLNLLLSHKPLEVKDLLDCSFAAFQERKSRPSFKRQWDQMLSDLAKTLPKGKCDTTDPYEVLENVQKRSEIQKEVKWLTRSVFYERRIDAYKEYLKPGRLFLHKNKGIYVVFQTRTDHGRLICAAHNLAKTSGTRKRRLKLRKVDLDQIKGIFDCRINFPEDYSSERLETLFDAIPLKDLKRLSIDIPGQDITTEESASLKQKFGILPCEDCEHLQKCHRAKKGPLKKLLRDFHSLSIHIEEMGGGLWLSFKRHVRFLKETGFVDDMDQLTPDGYWSTKLRLDQPLLIAEAIRKDAFSGVSPEILAGGLAPFVWDRIQDLELKIKGAMDLTEMDRIFQRILDRIEDIRALKTRRGFESPPILFWPAAALYFWAKGVPWERLLDSVSIDEGDMASLITRTADHLRQITNLGETHRRLASRAEDAIDLIMREPVYIP
jgi:ATP-dependent RNA helicase HelY